MALNEADTRAKLIDPGLHRRGWTEEHIRREETAGAVEIGPNGKPRRRARGRVDYTLRLRVGMDTQPVAVAMIEAKAEHLPPGHGLEQAKGYAACKRLNVQFVFSCNGHQFVEFDSVTGLTSKARPLAEFPTPDTLRKRYEAAKGFSLGDEAAKPLLAPYTGGEATRRYYQDAAIRATFEKVARCAREGEPPRALLSLATGSGKTFIAVNLLKRIADGGQVRRALFVSDRDELRTQASGAFQNLFGSNAAIVSGGNAQKNARVLIATYQTLGVEDEEAKTASFLARHYPEDYFSHIVIDECHRSAWNKWSQVLTRNPNAVQIGLTATPRKLEVREDSEEARADLKLTADNLRYFGEPVYEYDMSQGMEDGYLAACEIQKGRVNLDETGITLEEIIARQPRDATTGRLLSEQEIRDRYEKTEFEGVITLPDRVLAMTQDLFDYLVETGGPEQKTIIFCVRDRHADEVAVAMNNLYAKWCEENGRERLDSYAFKCTAASNGNDQLPDLRGASRSHFVATTVDLLTTGVDVPAVRNIVFFKYVNSPISFYQMVGRGTRIDPPSGKLMFRVYDYTDATRLFGSDFVTKPPRSGGGGEGPEPPQEPIVQVEGFDVHVNDAGRYIVTQVDGKAMPVTVEEYQEKLAASLVKEAPTLARFRRRWVDPEERRNLFQQLPDAGKSAIIIQQLRGMQGYDLYDVLAELGYGLNPLTRPERASAFAYKHEAWLGEMPKPAASTLRAIASQFSRAGTEGLESVELFRTPEVKAAGGLAALKKVGKPAEVLMETKRRMFAA
jgi:type I restriction enzyme R subunit